MLNYRPLMWFQFYLSSIKRVAFLLFPEFFIQFQFYLSSIKSAFPEEVLQAEDRFQFYLSSIKRRSIYIFCAMFM